MELILKDIRILSFDDIDHKDYPKFCDAVASKATYQGRDMTDEELDYLNDNHSDFVHEKLMDYLY